MTRIPCLFLLLAACGDATPGGPPGKPKRDDYALPVRVVAPVRGPVEDTVETQATLESERLATVYAEADGRVTERLRDLGDRVGEDTDGGTGLVLARLDDRDLALALKDAEAKLLEKEGRVDELELEQTRAARELEQAKVALEEAAAAHERTKVGLADGTISLEENEKAAFASKLAASKVETAEATLDKARLGRELARAAVEQAVVARDRAKLALERATVVAPFPGIVTWCGVREGEMVKAGAALYTVEDPQSLLVYADLPVRQAVRTAAGDTVRAGSAALGLATTGTVVLVSPVVSKESGTVRVKIAVDPAPGFKPGLFVAVRIVTETRPDALTVPARAVLHDDVEGAYLFTVDDGKATRRAVRTGFLGAGTVEIAEGLPEGSRVVVEGQDTLTDGARVTVKE